MRRIGVLLLILVISYMFISCKAETGYGEEIVNSYSVNGNYYLSISVIEGKIEDKNEFAEKLIKMCRDNSFESMKFSYDEGYPKSMFIKIYLKDSSGDKSKNSTAETPVMEIEYVPDDMKAEYNIIENPEKYSLDIKSFET